MIVITMPFADLKLATSTFKNPRTHSGLDDRSIGELAIHVGIHGLLNPPLVTKQGVVVAGQRRYRAIEFLIYWFSSEPMHARDQKADHPHFVDRFGERGWNLTHAEVSQIERNTRKLQRACPVRMVGGEGLGGISIADNVQRAQLTGGEVARHLHHLQEEGATGLQLARLIGKSPSYVSRKLTAWRSACPELREAWVRGEIADERVQELAAQPHEDQIKALGGPIPRGRRGPANRPGIDTIKELVGDLERAGHASQNPRMEVGVARYAAGVVDAMRWIAGENASRELAQLINTTEGEAK